MQVFTTMVLAVFLSTTMQARATGEDVTVQAYGVMPNGERRPNVKIVREEVERTTLMPLLPYVFFDSASATIPSRYVTFSTREASVFSEAEFTASDAIGNKSSIAAYYNLLNVIGKRLRAEPTAHISITGSTDGSELPALAQKRADAVAEYLKSAWGIGDERLAVQALVLPAKPSVSVDKRRAAQENRRVSIEGDWAIVKPVIVRDTTTTVSPPGVEFDVKTTISDVSSFTIRAWQGNYEEPLYLYEHVQLPRTARQWHLDRDPAKQPTTNEDLEYEAVIHDGQHHVYESETGSIPVEQVTLSRKKSGMVRGGTEIHQYNLILFDFGSTVLRPDHERIIDSMIADDGYVLPYSTIDVVGYADSLGTTDINQRLSADRALGAAERVKTSYASILAANAVHSEGIGTADILLLPSGLEYPEARMYSRTVHIIVQNRRER